MSWEPGTRGVAPAHSLHQLLRGAPKPHSFLELLTKSITHIPKLVELDLSMNLIDAIPAEVICLRELRELWYSEVGQSFGFFVDDVFGRREIVVKVRAQFVRQPS